MHKFYAVHADNTLSRRAFPASESAVPYPRSPGSLAAYAQSRSVSLNLYHAMTLQWTLPPRTSTITKFIDGKRNLRAIYNAIVDRTDQSEEDGEASEISFESFMKDFNDMFYVLNGLELMYFTQPMQTPVHKRINQEINKQQVSLKPVTDRDDL
eukprot:GILJ01031378.1.p1 GENE.GILJ01031378.1~~GILJ01031378.1.p1  ORF type:complete len:154 (+),score=22.16 GILJ01031378.1:175-636(+)